MKKVEKNKEEFKPKYKRLQDADWELVKDNFKLLYVYKSDRGNIKGIYSNGVDKVSHWMNEKEKEEYLKEHSEEGVK